MESRQEAMIGNEKAPGEVLRHPLRVRILAACTERETTIREFAEREKVRESKADYHFRTLLKEGYIKVVRKEPVRGFRRHVYAATRLGLISDREFSELEAEEQHRVSSAVIKSFHGRCLVALQADTFDSRDDSHFTWAPRMLDAQGWKDQMEDLLRSYERSNQIETESKERLKRNREEGIPTTIALAGFESPAEEAPGLESPPEEP
jgi:predicted ArsR family transcriptional regulator